MEKWLVAAKRADFNEIGRKFSIDPVIARIIRNRDVVGEEAVRTYLTGSLSELCDPHLLKDVDLAVEILQEKIGQKRRIRVIGDYDIDGIQSSYILWRGLTSCGARVDVAIPDRIADGYGLNERLVRQAAADGIDTIITCDNGIAAYDEIAMGKGQGMTILVTDHHEVPYEEGPDGRIYRIPPADAVVNPRQEGCGYPWKGLCGAAVAFKLVQVLYEAFGKGPEEIWDYLPYAAIATVGDVMELQGENRILVKEGLRRLRCTDNEGLLALIAQNQLAPGQIDAYHIGFILGPCMNASGRLDTAERALRLMCTKDPGEAARLAKDLVDLNTGRKELTAQGVLKAQALAEEAAERGDKVLVLYLPQCHESLAGIIAGRIREAWHRPTFVVTQGEEGAKGSGRSIEEYSMYQELCKVKELFTKFGGHPMAAGFSLPVSKVPLLGQRLNELTALTEEDLIPKIHIDVPMPLDYITQELVEQLELLAPFGKGNEKPVFADRKISILSSRIVGKNQNVCKMNVSSAGGRKLEAVYFGDAEEFLAYYVNKSRNKSEKTADFVYYPQINTYQGQKSLQIVVKNYR